MLYPWMYKELWLDFFDTEENLKLFFNNFWVFILNMNIRDHEIRLNFIIC